MNKRTKVLAIVALGLALVVAGVSYAIVASRTNATPDTVVARFYGSWIQTLEKGRSPLEAGLHTRSTYVTESFGREVERAARKSADYVLCGAGVPKSFTQEGARISRNTTTAAVTFFADTVEGTVILAKDERGWWRIDEVDCPSKKAPAPVEATSTQETIQTLYQ